MFRTGELNSFESTLFNRFKAKLFMAIENGDFELMSRMLEFISPKVKNDDGLSPLRVLIATHYNLETHSPYPPLYGFKLSWNSHYFETPDVQNLALMTRTLLKWGAIIDPQDYAHIFTILRYAKEPLHPDLFLAYRKLQRQMIAEPTSSSKETLQDLKYVLNPLKKFANEPAFVKFYDDLFQIVKSVLTLNLPPVLIEMVMSYERPSTPGGYFSELLVQEKMYTDTISQITDEDRRMIGRELVSSHIRMLSNTANSNKSQLMKKTENVPRSPKAKR